MVTTTNALDVSPILAEGRELLHSDPAGAAERAGRVLALVPHSPDGYRLLGAALRRLGQDAAANDAELAAISIVRIAWW